MFSPPPLQFASVARALPLDARPLRKYISPDGSFQLTVPVGYGVHVGRVKPISSYIPVCSDASSVCITFPSDAYRGTTFGAAAVEVTQLSAKSMQACLTPGNELSTSPDAMFQIDSKSPTRMIGGKRFLHSFVYAAAMSHYVAEDLYRGYETGRCYELSLRITFTNFRVYPAGAIKEFTTSNQKHVHAELERIIDSFRAIESPR